MKKVNITSVKNPGDMHTTFTCTVASAGKDELLETLKELFEIEILQACVTERGGVVTVVFRSDNQQKVQCLMEVLHGVGNKN